MLLAIAGIALAAPSSAWADQTAGTNPPERPTLNQTIVDLAMHYKKRGGYAWPGPGIHGTTRNLSVNGNTFARIGKGTHCSGITLEVLWRALERTRRGVSAVLTTAGRRALRKAGPTHDKGINSYFLGALNAGDKKALRSALRKVLSVA